MTVMYPLNEGDRGRLYGIAGRAAGEAALRSATDAFLLSRIARAIVDAILDDEGRDA
jgi:hypothetical protein